MVNTRKLNPKNVKSLISTIAHGLINNKKLPSVTIFKDLEIYISENLKWNDHINYIYNIASVSSYQALKSFKTNTVTTLTKLFIFLCALSWSSTFQFSPSI